MGVRPHLLHGVLTLTMSCQSACQPAMRLSAAPMTRPLPPFHNSRVVNLVLPRSFSDDLRQLHRQVQLPLEPLQGGANFQLYLYLDSISRGPQRYLESLAELGAIICREPGFTSVGHKGYIGTFLGARRSFI